MATTIKVVNNGLGIITGLVSKITTLAPLFVGWGTGVTAAAITDTGLQTPAAEARTSGTVTQQQTTVANDTFRNVASITCATAGKAITEAAIFDAATAGNLFVRAVFDAVNVAVGDSIQFTFNVSFVSG